MVVRLSTCTLSATPLWTPMIRNAPTPQAPPITGALSGALRCAQKRRPTPGSTEPNSMSSSLAQTVSVPPTPLIHLSKIYEQRTTKPLHHLPSTATLVLRNLAERSMPQPPLAATWATNTSPSAKAKAMTHRRARMLAMLRQPMIAGTQPPTAASCHAYVSNCACFKTPSTKFSYTDPRQVFFNAYVLSKNAIPQGLYCSMYNQTWGPSYATNYGQYRGSDRYTVSESYSYTKSS